MYLPLCLFLLTALASLVDATRSSFANSHARRSLSLKHRDPQGNIIGGLTSVLAGLVDGQTNSSTSSVLPPTSTQPPVSSTSTASSCAGLLDLGLGCTPSPTPTTTPTPSPSPTTSCDGLLDLVLGCSTSQTSTPSATTTPSPSPSLSPSTTTTASPSPSSATSTSTTPSPSPTTSCGLLGLILGCSTSQTSTPSTTMTPSSSPSLAASTTTTPSPSSNSATSTTTTPSSSPTTSCGLLGLILGCSTSRTSITSTTMTPSPSPSSATTTTIASSPSPSSCDGLVDLVLGCTASQTSTTSTKATPWSSLSLIPSLTAPLSSLPNLTPPTTIGSSSSPDLTPFTTTTTSFLAYSTPSIITTHSSSPNSTPLGSSFTSPSTSPTDTGATSPPPSASTPSSPLTTTIITSQSSATSSFTRTATGTGSIPSNSNYNYLSTVFSLLLNPASSTASPTISNPDLPATTLSLLSVAPTASPSVPPLPSGLPRVILPQPTLDVNNLPSDDSMINILFNASLNWQFVAENADSPGQLFEYFPTVVAAALAIDVGEVQNYQLVVYEPSSYNGPADVAKLGTVWQGYIPSDNVSTLASLISNQKSSFYTAQVGTIPSELAACVDPSFQLNAIPGPTPGGSSSTGASSSGSNNVRQDAIIGVVSSLGAIAVIIVAYVGYKAYQRRRALSHRRLPDTAAYAGVRPEGQEFDRDSVGGRRRRSFYYAEDSLRGYQSTRVDEEGHDHSVTNMRERRAIQPGIISTPILRESTMNW